MSTQSNFALKLSRKFILQFFVFICFYQLSFAQSTKKLEITFIDDCIQDTNFYYQMPHFQRLSAFPIEIDSQIYLIGINRNDRNIFVQRIFGNPSIPDLLLFDSLHKPLQVLRNHFIYNDKIYLYTLNNLISIEQQGNNSFNCASSENINRRLGVTAKAVYRNKHSTFILASKSAFICRNTDAPDPMRSSTLQLFELTTDTVKLIWSSAYMKDLTQNLGFNNFYWNDKNFVYFNPLLYTAESLDLETGKINYYDFAEKAGFVKSNLTMMLLKDNVEQTRYKSYNDFLGSEELNDRILTTFKTPDGYLIWRTKEGNSKYITLDFILNDFSSVHNLSHPFKGHGFSDSTDLGSYENFNFSPLNHWVSFVGDKMIVAIPYQTTEPSPRITGQELYLEWEKCGMYSDRKSYIKYLIFDYQIY